MDFLKELFGDQALTFEQFSNAVTGKGYKLADLSTGGYVDKRKFDDSISSKENAIEDLKNQIKTRDNDIKALQEKLTGDADSEAKIADLTNQLETLRGNYDTAKKDYEARLGKQSYEFAVSEYANGLKFTSEAAKRDFKREMIEENLKMKNGTIIGADDFLNVYKEANTDSFVVETQQENEDPKVEPKPTFVQPTAPQVTTAENPFSEVFTFSGVRAKE